MRGPGRGPEPVSALRERYMYLKGLADAAPKGGTEPRDQLLRQIVDLLGEVVERLCEIEQRMKEGSHRGEAVRERHKPSPEAGTISCPLCGEPLLIGPAVAEGRRVEITCPNCNTELEIEP